mgnify:CR=1 FL=1
MKKIILACSLLVLSACTTPSDDMDAICDEATKVSKQQGEYANLSTEDRAVALAKNVDARIKSTPIRNAWDAIASAAPAQKYELMQVAAAEAGVEGWDCPQLEQIWAATASPEPSGSIEPAQRQKFAGVDMGEFRPSTASAGRANPGSAGDGVVGPDGKPMGEFGDWR